MMRWLVLLMALGVSAPTLGAPAPLLPLITPAPEYPQALLEKQYFGRVRALLEIDSSGKVVEARAIESSHPLLTAVVEQTLSRWRFMPRLTAGGAPARITVTLPVIFGLHDVHGFDSRISVGLRHVSCAYLNNEVALQTRNFPNAALNQVDMFWYTGQFLRSSYAVSQRGDKEREVLLKQLEAALPSIVARCAARPRSHYGDHLPKGIRRLLWVPLQPERVTREVAK